MASRLARLSGFALVLAGAGVGHANGSHDGPGRAEPATRFEAFLIRVQGSAVGYVQAGDVSVLPPASPVDAPAAVFLPATDLPALQAAIVQGAERIQKLRSP